MCKTLNRIFFFSDFFFEVHFISMSGFPYIKHPLYLFLLYFYEWWILQPHLPHHLASGVLTPGINIFINIQIFIIMERNLIFNETLTVEQFKAAMNVSRIDVKQNPKTNKLFFTYGAKTGAVAVKGIPQHPMLSNVTGSDGQSFWLLHEEGQGGAPVLASF